MANEHILIIEDDQQLAAELQSYFGELGYQMQAVPRDLEAVNHAMREALPGLILLAIPNSADNASKDPICQELWNPTRSRYIPMIFMCTKDDPPKNYIQDLEIPGTNSIIKPMDFLELKIRVQNELFGIERWKEHDARWKRKSGS
ncbi:MAG TPA: hypothetical protein VKQ72_15700 [Aggregatilineales bacterium]|nr:hypothetical protein [Aggregatilineales bacterium]